MIRELNSIMEFEHVVRVEGGHVSDEEDSIYAPECYFNGWGDDVHIEPGTGWELLTGFSGQGYPRGSYNGPIMHPSEYIGGYMEQYILANDGYYVAVECDVLGDGEMAEYDEDPAGWAVAYRPL